MTRYEIIKMNEQLFKLMRKNSIDIGDVQYLALFEEYKRMKAKKHKVSYIVCFLSDKYDVTERGIYKIIKRFGERVKV
ncbi:MAG: hypothetical protein ACI3ZD_02290 [Prevotella sp.]